MQDPGSQQVEQLLIPIANSDRQEHVVVYLDHLPPDAEDIIDILKAEEAPISLWLDFAKAYLQHEGLDQYLDILKYGIPLSKLVSSKRLDFR